MLQALALMFGAILLPILASPLEHKNCPLDCTCTDTIITCQTVDFPELTDDFLELRLIRVKEPFVIEKDFLNSKKLLSLDTLYVEGCSITSIKPAAFENIPLRAIHLVNSTLPKLAADTFLYATSLKLLNIEKCNFEPEDDLKSESLEQLRISSCHLKEITKTTFLYLNDLTDLNLPGNKIERVHPGSFKSLTFLSDLNLSNNNISQLPRGIFDENQELVSISLRGNPLKKIDTSVLADVEWIDLSNCQLKEFKGGELDPNYLDLSNNLLTKLSSDAFENMTSLEYLDLSKNVLTSLPTDVFVNNSRLARIILDHNDLPKLPKFKNNENFQTELFSCNDCGLESIESDIFQDMPGLVKLHLSNNRIEKIDSNTFSLLKALKVLDLSYNSIQHLEKDAFKHNAELKKLNLAGNNILDINPEIFAENKFLETLNVSNNGILEMWKRNVENATLPSLQVLIFADNKISKISVSDLKVVPNLKVLNVNNNDLECSNDFKEAIRWLTMRDVIHSSSGLSAQLNADQMFTFTDTYWNDFYSASCDYVDSEDTEDDENEDSYNYDKDTYEDDIETLRMLNGNWPSENDANEYFEQDIVVNHIYTGERYGFVWPMLVFIVTALFVLFIVTNVILCVLRKRGQLPRNINLQWKNGANNGFVYKPLTEDISRPRSIIITQVDKPQAPNL